LDDLEEKYKKYINSYSKLELLLGEYEEDKDIIT
jgi:hypothetical protein